MPRARIPSFRKQADIVVGVAAIGGCVAFVVLHLMVFGTIFSLLNMTVTAGSVVLCMLYAMHRIDAAERGPRPRREGMFCIAATWWAAALGIGFIVLLIRFGLDLVVSSSW